MSCLAVTEVGRSEEPQSSGRFAMWALKKGHVGCSSLARLGPGPQACAHGWLRRPPTGTALSAEAETDCMLRSGAVCHLVRLLLMGELPTEGLLCSAAREGKQVTGETSSECAACWLGTDHLPRFAST